MIWIIMGLGVLNLVGWPAWYIYQGADVGNWGHMAIAIGLIMGIVIWMYGSIIKVIGWEYEKVKDGIITPWCESNGCYDCGSCN